MPHTVCHILYTTYCIPHTVLCATGESRLREVFLKADNDMGGRYYAELIKVSVIWRELVDTLCVFLFDAAGKLCCFHYTLTL